MVDISIIVVNFNGKRYLKAFFEALIQMEKGQFSVEIVFVDNASTDGSVEYVRQNGYDEKLSVTIVENTTNQGFARGNNTGVKSSHGKYVVFLNNDTAVNKDWLVNLYKFYKAHEDCGAVGSKLLFFYDFIGITFRTSDKIRISPIILVNNAEYKVDRRFSENVLLENYVTCYGDSRLSLPLLQGDREYVFIITVNECNKEGDRFVVGGKEISIRAGENLLRYGHDEIMQMKYQIVQNAGSGMNENYEGFDYGMGEIDAGQYEEERITDNGCGAALLVERSLFDSLQGFDERFFMYYEDTDLSFRIRRTGKKIYYCPNAVVRHIHTGSSGEWSPFFTYHVFRNWLVFIYKNESVWKYIKKSIRMILDAIKYKDRMRLVCVRDAFLMGPLNRECKYKSA